MRLHVYPPEGMRPEDSEQYFAAIEREIRHVIPPEEISLILDNIGLPNGGINLAFGDSSVISDSDGDILISLNPGQAADTALHARVAYRSAYEVPRRNLLLHACQHHHADP